LHEAILSEPFSALTGRGWKRLEILEAATTSLNDLRGLPSNRLEALKGDRAGASARNLRALP
jgi:plasmid maintenance system killer protein